VSVEPIQNWRPVYSEKFSYLKNSSDFDTSLLRVKKDLSEWFVCTYNLEKRADPLPRLGALQLLLRKKGSCEDVAGLAVFTLRSQSIPASVDHVPAWATSSGNHTLNVAWNKIGKPVPYDILSLGDSISHFVREPAKVIRYTYSKQKSTLLNYETISNIPPGFMQLSNYKDVTDEYWVTQDVTCKLYGTIKSKERIVYACVFNNGKWTPTWWGIPQNNSVLFTNMCKGAVFIPMQYVKGQLVSAGNPKAIGYQISTEIKADTINKKTVVLNEQEHYLRYRTGKKYRLYYWNNKTWRFIAEKTAGEGQVSLTFSNVPQNALYILIPEYSQKKERPFTFTADGTRLWW
jgi:hypothetical protein